MRLISHWLMCILHLTPRHDAFALGDRRSHLYMPNLSMWRFKPQLYHSCAPRRPSGCTGGFCKAAVIVARWRLRAMSTGGPTMYPL